jgi:addiction module HigA family antidote
MAEFKAGARKRRPTHPGRIVKSSLDALELTTYAAAPLLGVTKQALGNLVAEKSSVSPEMALRLGRFFRNGPELWLRMQGDVDLWDAAQKIGAEIEAIEPADWEGREEFEG